MPSDRDLVTAVINGREFDGWTGATITMSVDHVSDAFSLVAPYDPASPILAAIRPRTYPKVEIKIGGELLLTGVIEKHDPQLTDSGRVVNYSGRSKTGPLNDCAIDGPLEFSGLALSTIARQICARFGIQVRADNDTGPIDEARAEYGQTAADFLNSLAAPRLLLLNSSYDGKLVLTWGKALKDRPVVADLTEGEGDVIEVNASFDDTKVFSVYRAATQFADDVDQVGSVSNPGVVAYRPRLILCQDSDTDPAITARRVRAESESSALEVSVRLAGWRRPDGKRWAERQAVTLLAPSQLLRTRAKYIIAECSLSLTESGKTTNLRLVLPETYSGESPRETPWL